MPKTKPTRQRAVTLEPPKAAKRANVVATKARCRAHETQNVQGGTPDGQRPKREEAAQQAKACRRTPARTPRRPRSWAC
jgi:hypothetical protein